MSLRMSEDDRDRPARRGASWPVALLAVALLVLVAGAFYALHVLRALPAEVAAQGRRTCNA